MNITCPATNATMQRPDFVYSIKMETTPSPRVLCISPFFPPLANPEAFCGGKVALHLLAAGVDVTVFDVDYVKHPKFSRDVSPVWHPLERITSSVPPDGNKTKLLSPLLGLRYFSPEWSRWIATVVANARRLHRVRPCDVVYSRSLPNVAHIAAYWVSRAIRRPWIANFNDPWDLEGAHLLPQDRHKRKRTLALRASDFWLRRVMRKADTLTFPSSRLRDYHLRLAQARGKSVVVPHIGSSTSPVQGSGFFELVHAGNLGSGESTRRNATNSLLRAMRGFFDHRPDARKHFRLVLVGPEDRPTLTLAHELDLNGNVSCTGRVSYVESLQAIASATVCLLVEGNMPEGIYLPSKFADYIQARKPVIALSPSTGTIADLRSSRGITQVSHDDLHAIETALARHYDAFTSGQIAALEPCDELMSQYDGTRIGQQLRDLCADLAARSSP